MEISSVIPVILLMTVYPTAIYACIFDTVYPTTIHEFTFNIVHIDTPDKNQSF